VLRPTLAALALTSACAFTPAGDGAAATDDAAPTTDARSTDGPALDAAIDARPIDAPPPCPGDYVGGYRLIPTAQSWRAAEADCEDDTTGLSHLVVIDNAGELAAVNAALAALAAGDVWVGVMRDAPMPWVWRAVTGGNASYLPWETGQPDDQSGDQQVVSLMRASGLLRDVSTGSSTNRAALCECDRRPPVDADYRP